MRRFAFAAAMAAGIGFAQNPLLAQTADAPDTFGLSNITDHSVQELQLPQNAGETFRTMVDLGGLTVLLNLEPFSMRSADFKVMVNDEAGRHEMVNVPAPATYRGEIDGMPGSTIAGSLVNGQLNATIDLEQDWFWVIEPMTQYVPGADPKDHIVYRSFDVIEKDGMCGVDDGGVLAHEGHAGASSSPEVTKILDLAIDTDYEYYLLRGQSTASMISDIELIISRVHSIYERDVDVLIEISHMELRTTSSDPYTSNNAQTLLNQFSSYWFNNMGQVDRDLAELFSGRNFDGSTIGIAWINGVCSKSIGYSAIQNTGLSLAGRIGVSAHELGHNFNAPHCSGSDCRIMCAGLGGCAGDISRFGQASINTIRVAASRARCMTSPPPPSLAFPFSDTFPSTTFTPDTWGTTTGTIIGTFGINPPSAPYTVIMNQVATLETVDVEVSSSIYPTPVFVSYWIQHRAVESGETLKVEYRDGAGLWKTFETIVSDGTNPFGFKPSEFKLAQSDYGMFFRLSFRATGDDGNDLWMIDDVSISDRCLADVDANGTLDIFDFLGFQDLFVTSSPLADLTGDGSHDIFDFLAYQNMFASGCY